MEIKIVPSSELAIHVDNKKVGQLDALRIDLGKSVGLFSMPKIKLSISIHASAFSNQANLDALLNKVCKYNFLEITLIKPVL